MLVCVFQKFKLDNCQSCSLRILVESTKDEVVRRAAEERSRKQSEKIQVHVHPLLYARIRRTSYQTTLSRWVWFNQVGWGLHFIEYQNSFLCVAICRMLVLVRGLMHMLVLVRGLMHMLVLVRGLMHMLVLVRGLMHMLVLVRGLMHMLVLVRGLMHMLVLVRGLMHMLVLVRGLMHMLVLVRGLMHMLVLVRGLMHMLVLVRGLMHMLQPCCKM